MQNLLDDVQIYSIYVCLVVAVCVRIFISISCQNATTTIPGAHVMNIMHMHTPACI